jgi:D-tyrosyl-tRNA(Tyr) deacylase
VRAVVQRVTSARVVVAGEDVGRIDGPGLLVLLGVHRGDGEQQIVTLARKIAGLRILRGEVSAVDAGAPVLLVSQFTLYADTGKGRRPSWSAAAPAEVAEPVVETFAETLRGLGLHVETGRFGADMAVESINDGPVTLLLEA